MTKAGAVAILLLLSCVGAGIGLTKWSSEKVRDAAEAVAKEDPYCIQVPGDGDYREVRALSDISILNMRAHTESSAQHHAVLAVDRIGGTELLHWSYRNQAFMGGVLGPPAIYCMPKPHYLAAVQSQSLSDSPVAVIRFEGMTLSIPRSFAPLARGNSRGVFFYAKSPKFEPLQASRKNGGRLLPDKVSAGVEVTFGKTGFLNRWLHKRDPSHRVEGAESEFGLSKQLVWYLPMRESPLYRPSVDYFVEAPDGEIESLISCDSAAGGDCMHSFYADGWTYTFHHRKEVLAEWKAMQVRLSSLARSFVSSGKVALMKEGLYESHLVYQVDRSDPLLQRKRQ